MVFVRHSTPFKVTKANALLSCHFSISNITVTTKKCRRLSQMLEILLVEEEVCTRLKIGRHTRDCLVVT